MSAPHINVSFVLSVCQKLSNLVDIWQTCDKNNFAQFFGTRCITDTAGHQRALKQLVITHREEGKV